jgi:hypothetical protein
MQSNLHQIITNTLVLYKRNDKSPCWYGRYKHIHSKKWVKFSTKTIDLEKAKDAARKVYARYMNETRPFYKNTSKSTPPKRKRLCQKSIKLQLYRAAQARAKKQNVPFSITVDDIIIPELCPVLNIPLYPSSSQATDNSPSLDKIVPELGYVPHNIAVISQRANRLKSNASCEELKKLLDYVSS